MKKLGVLAHILKSRQPSKWLTEAKIRLYYLILASIFLITAFVFASYSSSPAYAEEPYSAVVAVPLDNTNGTIPITVYVDFYHGGTDNSMGTWFDAKSITVPIGTTLTITSKEDIPHSPKYWINWRTDCTDPPVQASLLYSFSDGFWGPVALYTVPTQDVHCYGPNATPTITATGCSWVNWGLTNIGSDGLNISYFSIYMSQNSDDLGSGSQDPRIGPYTTVNKDTRSYTFSSLGPGTYYVRIRAVSPQGVGSWSSVGSFSCGSPITPASNLIATPSCPYAGSGNIVTVQFSWTQASPSSYDEQWLDYSVWPNNFTSDFKGVKVTGSSHTEDGLAQNVTYYWRINTRFGSTWYPSLTYTFTTPSCSPNSGNGTLYGDCTLFGCTGPNLTVSWPAALFRVRYKCCFVDSWGEWQSVGSTTSYSSDVPGGIWDYQVEILLLNNEGTYVQWYPWKYGNANGADTISWNSPKYNAVLVHDTEFTNACETGTGGRLGGNCIDYVSTTSTSATFKELSPKTYYDLYVLVKEWQNTGAEHPYNIQDHIGPTGDCNCPIQTPTPTPTPTPPPPPDYTIRNSSGGTNPPITVSNGSLVNNILYVAAGTSVTFSFTTKNISGNNACCSSTTVVEAYGSTYPNGKTDISVQPLGGNSSASHSFTTSWSTEGTYGMLFRVDAYGNLNELDESNNDVELTVIVSTPCDDTAVGDFQLVGCFWKGNFDESTNTFTPTVKDGQAQPGANNLTSDEYVEALYIDWGNSGPPNNFVGSDNFYAKWQGWFNFKAGTYLFIAGADDGVRVKVDDTRIIDSWKWTGYYEGDPFESALQDRVGYFTFDANTAGLHKITLEYFEYIGAAKVTLKWGIMPTVRISQVSPGPEPYLSDVTIEYTNATLVTFPQVQNPIFSSENYSSGTVTTQFDKTKNCVAGLDRWPVAASAYNYLGYRGRAYDSDNLPFDNVCALPYYHNKVILVNPGQTAKYYVSLGAGYYSINNQWIDGIWPDYCQDIQLTPNISTLPSGTEINWRDNDSTLDSSNETLSLELQVKIPDNVPSGDFPFKVNHYGTCRNNIVVSGFATLRIYVYQKPQNLQVTKQSCLTTGYLSAQFSWQTDAPYSIIQVAKDPSFNNDSQLLLTQYTYLGHVQTFYGQFVAKSDIPITRGGNLSDGFFEPNKTYYWRVKSSLVSSPPDELWGGYHNQSNWSETASFETSKCGFEVTVSPLTQIIPPGFSGKYSVLVNFYNWPCSVTLNSPSIVSINDDTSLLAPTTGSLKKAYRRQINGEDITEPLTISPSDVDSSLSVGTNGCTLTGEGVTGQTTVYAFFEASSDIQPWGEYKAIIHASSTDGTNTKTVDSNEFILDIRPAAWFQVLNGNLGANDGVSLNYPMPTPADIKYNFDPDGGTVYTGRTGLSSNFVFKNPSSTNPRHVTPYSTTLLPQLLDFEGLKKFLAQGVTPTACTPPLTKPGVTVCNQENITLSESAVDSNSELLASNLNQNENKPETLTAPSLNLNKRSPVLYLLISFLALLILAPLIIKQEFKKKLLGIGLIIAFSFITAYFISNAKVLADPVGGGWGGGPPPSGSLPTPTPTPLPIPPEPPSSPEPTPNPDNPNLPAVNLEGNGFDGPITNPVEIGNGGWVWLKWSTINATSCQFVSGAKLSPSPTNLSIPQGGQLVGPLYIGESYYSPNSALKYEISCSDGSGNSASDAVYVKINPSLSGPTTPIYFIDGNLSINQDFVPQTLTVFFVGGNITVSDNVKEIKGIFYTLGDFTTQTSNNVQTPLVVTGSVLAPNGNINLNRSLGFKNLGTNTISGVSFTCSQGDYDCPAEVFNFTPEHLVTLRPQLGLINYTWTEVAP